MSVKLLVRKVRERLAFQSWYTDEFLKELHATRIAAERTAKMAKEQYVAHALAEAPYADPLRLERFGLKIYSQYEEDGIIAEIFRRIGTTNEVFVEFGVETGVENNTRKLLLDGWRGLWIECSERHIAAIRTDFSDLLESNQLFVKQGFITAENINEVLHPWPAGEIDLLSIDIDGNDYYIFEALRIIQPRVIVIEYKAQFPPPISVVQEYQPNYRWSGGDYGGASLEALARLGKRRGYCLVGTTFTGLNAFFVRADLAEGKFQTPFSAENHYNRPRFFLWQPPTPGCLPAHGCLPDKGRYVRIPD